jgi:hypothetical protein
MKINIFLLFIIFSFSACDILRDSPFEVISWSPGEGYHSQPEEIVVSMEFSHDPDRASVERRFSLSGDDGKVKGNYIWKGRKMIFSPLTPLEPNMDYNINLSAEARNTWGLSMDTAFDVKFSTRPGNDRPVLISCYPDMYEEISDTRSEVRILFSISVPLSKLYDYVSFYPSITGFWRLEDDGRLAVFTPGEEWQINKRYEIRYSTSLTDNKGMNARNDFTSIFTVGIDKEEPVLLFAGRLTKSGELLLLDPDNSLENCGWEKDDRLELLFSKPVDGLTLKNYLSVEGASSLVMENAIGYEEAFTFHFETIPVFESRFVIKIKPGVKDVNGNESKDEYVFRIFADGKLSKPPEFMGIRMPMAPGSGADMELASFGTDSFFELISIKDGSENYPSGVSISTWIELYFNTAEEAEIDIFSLMELFRIETSNNVIVFSPRGIRTNNFSVFDPHAEWKNYKRVEIAGTLINSTNLGIISFQIASGLKDSLNNKNDKLQRISVIK